MAAHTTLLEFIVPPTTLKNPAEQKVIRQDLQDILTSHGLTFAHSHTTDLPPGSGLLLQFLDDGGRHATLRLHPEGLVTVDIHEYIAQGTQPKYTPEIIRKIGQQIKENLKSQRSIVLPAVKRGGLDVYFPLVDNTLVEYDFDKCVFEQNSEYQNIKIMHSNQYGNVLILDDDVNLAESDIAYTHAITGHGRESYDDKSVLILGGGDGGILNELLKQKPKDVVMVDIDQVVVDAAKKHLRGICNNALDKLKGENYEVLIADCVPILEKYISEGRQFDYIINDLTAIPISTEPIGDQWDFLRKILDYSMKVMKPEGKYFTQGNGFNATSALQMYENQLYQLQVPVDFKKETVCVPSYREMWVFYELTVKQGSSCTIS